MSKKICILGKLATKFRAPFEDESWEIWSMNKHEDGALLPRIDVWYDLHKDKEARTYNPNADIKREDFPFEECHKLVGGQFFNNTVSYLIAYAIIKGATDIALYGMRFHRDHERRRGEFHNVRELIFFAKGRGINVTAPADGEVMLAEYIPIGGKDFDQ